MSEKVKGSYGEFSKIDLHSGKIVKTEPVPQLGNLIKLSIGLDKGKRPVAIGSQIK